MSRLLRPLTLNEARQFGVSTVQPSADRNLLKNAPRMRQQGSINGRAGSGEVNAPAYQLSLVFPYQSYFSDTLAEKALFRQPPNQPIVPSTQSTPVQVSGYAVGLHPSSETPIAISFSTGAQQGASPTYVLRPGQVVWPNGRPGGVGAPGHFGGFVWGLPFGWLGGGSAALVVLRTADADVTWPADHVELAYHRIRMNVNTAAEVNALITAGAYSGPMNWPSRFPWPFATFGANALAQSGQPALAIQPTRTALSLRLATVAASTMRMYFVGADVWASDSAGAISLADVRNTDITWGTQAQQAGVNAPFNNSFQTLILTGEAERYAANAGAVVLGAIDAALNDAKVDVVRYGRL